MESVAGGVSGSDHEVDRKTEAAAKVTGLECVKDQRSDWLRWRYT